MALDPQKQIQTLQDQLETERNELAFTKLSLEDEMEKVGLGVQIIRTLRDETEDLKIQKIKWEADKELIEQMKKKIEFLEKENNELKNQNESFPIEKKAAEGVIDILRIQVQQSRLEAQKFQDLVTQSTEPVPVIQPANLNTNNEPPSSRKKSQLLLEKTKANLDQSLEEISLTPTLSMKFNSKLSDYHRAIQNHIQVMTEEIEKSKATNDQLKIHLFQERENVTLLLEAMENLEQQISCLGSTQQTSKLIEISVLVPEVKMKFGSQEKNEEKKEEKKEEIKN